MTAGTCRSLRRLCGEAIVLAAAACQGSDVTSPSTGELPVTAATRGNSANLLALTGHIAFVSKRAGNFEIYKMNANGTGVTRLTNNAAFDDVPDWSPNGTKIAFASDRDGHRQIYVMHADGSGVTRLTNEGAIDWAPDWSPNGTKIAFQHLTHRIVNRQFIFSFDIAVIPAGGGGITQLTHTGHEREPAWAPDGTKIAFTSNRDGNFEIYVMHADGSGATRLTNNPAFDFSPAWSPNGTKIAFASERDGNDEIYVMNANGSGVTRLTNNSAFDADPAWSPDGTTIAFVSERAGNDEIYVMNANGRSEEHTV